MKKIKIWADVHSTGLFNETGRFYSKEETTISDTTWAELQEWVDSYGDIAIMDDEERGQYENTQRIKKLDNRGLALLNIISKEWDKDIDTGEHFEFQYYSEGLMKLLDND